MADPRFHIHAGTRTLEEVARAGGAEILRGDPAFSLTDVAPLDQAGPGEIAFAEGRRNRDALRATRAGAVIVAAAMQADVPEQAAVLLARSPQLAFARIAGLFHPPPVPRPGIHPTAVVGEGAEIGERSEIGPYAVIGEGAKLGPGCIVGPHAVIGPNCVFGAGCRIHAQASAYFCLAGNGVVLHQGARVGNEGFGFVPDPSGNFVTVPQLGRVVLEDHVEIGANSCVDRGAAGDTVLGAGTRTDNLVMIGHNVRTGRGCIIVGQAGISGSTVLGDYVTVAAQAGLTGHLSIGTKARIGAQAGVMNDVPAGMDVLGSPAMPARDAMRGFAAVRRLAAKKVSTDRTE
ncbi:UDP-3-O-[3-hydroxymyristoyl] glucosamine N-acyltransferase [Roseomonas mucosa]|uniref:UDP-3-O-(3-hydroxymyristoyl)glucosamine N-acyltransferase n=1 Tax=Roseomonas TaxID=125216 RepID=UPI00095A762B|nr:MULTISPECIES: UDP-3-O-(3-hydroxymyristoyl)glucosamine N-acyltransferase [Roseomonas]MDT8265445.1 UDP-3-O-(3-hydroxymyristoyl)glucosamine N-acyltransferase [Roseomonas sp. DSM 102946]ATR20088.1 UDP-3-O-(3-hydroxymyristoyl)glucosamine N-acyltransferase [Roseomonas sp. FDAARGOS_362]USQ71862.1 UDP-3-O-(3-hydroxymyristoyl)glucosamine N-acyltransferase [Roseomonas mucosa]UZO97725.1 UDP-3-O-[3-hydroxymyristoyl] glucosamine N-acyltransferase [Roseomonas mucosa]GAV33136.1 UDP-3-O-acylglucosamine N-a